MIPLHDMEPRRRPAVATRLLLMTNVAVWIYVVLSPAARVRTLIFLGIFITIVTLPAIVVIGEWLIIQLLAGLDTMRIASHRSTENVAYVAHIVGFATGAIVGLVRR